MSKKIINNMTPELQIQTFEHESQAPKEIPVDDVKLRRVARPLRHVKHIPVKAQVFHSKNGPIEFSYENKIKMPIKKNKIVVQVSEVGLNPIDLKIKNGYTSAIYGEIGLGREYCGVITEVGSDIAYSWHVGDEVCGIYYHPHLGKGALQSSILIDPNVDPIILKPKNITNEEAAGSLYCLGTALNILDKLDKNKQLSTTSNVCINGGTSSVGMFAIQLLKRHYKVNKKIVVITSSNGPDVLKNQFPDLADELIFVNYLTCRGKASKPLRKMIDEKNIVDYTNPNDEIKVEYTQGKFDVVLDFVGGYDILSHSSSLIHSKGAYVTTVGDYVGDYETDVFNQWENPSANARKMFGSMIWSYSYTHFYFEPSVKSASKNNWIEKCKELLENGEVKCVVDKVFVWKQTTEAFKYMKTQRAQGKVVIKVEKF